MEDRSSPPATTSYYRPPIGVRHIESVSARNVVPPGGPPKRLAGVGVFFTLHECAENADEAAFAADSTPGRDAFADAPARAGALYTSEIVRDTLNPDWAPLGEALRDAAARRRDGDGTFRDDGSAHGSASSVARDASFRTTKAHDAATDAFVREGEGSILETSEGSRPKRKTTSRVVPLHERARLRVWFIPAPAGDVFASETRLCGPEDASVSMAFQCDVCLGALVPLPGGARGQKLVSLSESGGRARAGAVLSAPPNTPLLRTRSGAFSFESFRDGPRRSPGEGFAEPRASTDSSLNAIESDPLNPHFGWVVPRSKAWPALLAAAEAVRLRRDADAAATEAQARLFVSGGGSSVSGAAAAAAADGATREPGLDGARSAAAPARATTRQIRVASEAILDATRRLGTASATGARLKARVGANVERRASRFSGKTGSGSDARGTNTNATRVADDRATENENRLGFSTTDSAKALKTRAAARLDASRSRRAALAAAIETARAEADASRAATRARAAALRTSRDALRGAETRLRDADAIVKGPHGFGRLADAQRQLVARRWRLVGDLARVFPVTAFGAGARAEDASGSDASGGGLGSADESGARDESSLGDESSTGPSSETNLPREFADPVGDAPHGASSLPLAVAGVPLDHTGSLSRPNAALASGPGGSRGPGFDPGARRGADFSASAAHSLLNDPECAAAALGYATQATLQLASVLDVPLRYPVAPGASRSYICDLQQAFGAERVPAASASADGGASLASSSDPGIRTTPDASPSGASASPAPLWRRVEFPLFAEPHAAESTRFAYAVFLLNKDLEQLLNAHGLLAVGPRHTLQNLERLFAARKKKAGANERHANASGSA